MSAVDRDRDLATYYDQEAPMRATRTVGAERTRRRDEFARLLADEGRQSLLEIGVGPGRDALAFVSAAVAVTGVDLSAEHVGLARSDERVRAMLGAHGELERFETWTEAGTECLHYQFVVLRTRG